MNVKQIRDERARRDAEKKSAAPRPGFIIAIVGLLALALLGSIYYTFNNEQHQKALESGRAAQESLERAFR